jgi:hypothetical protein
VIAGYILYRLLFPETARQAAIKLLGCIERSDAGCLFGYVHETERDGLGLDVEKLEKLLRETTGRIVQEGGSPGQLTVDVQPEQARATAQRDYAGKNGVRVAITITVQAGDEGLTCSPIVWQIVKCACLAKALERAEGPTRIPAEFAAALREQVPVYERIGLTGVVEPSTDLHAQSWETLIQHWENVALDVASRKSTAQTP